MRAKHISAFGSVLLGMIMVAGVVDSARADEGTSSEASSDIDWAKERTFWSFVPPQARPQPAVQQKDWPRQPLDYFVLERLEARQFAPSPEADRRTLIRRLTFDLTGLPPTPNEVREFLEDKRAGAYAELVDRLLSSPRFGERLASLWLPLVRYAEDQAHQVGNDTTMFYPNAYLYRQWVIESFNHDMPYDQFIRFQLAADKVEGGQSELAGLGFLGLGPKYYGRGSLSVMADEWEDRVDTVMRTMQGLTVSCARCHDHKFDPITTRDYYALAGVFASTKMLNRAPDGSTVDGKVSADKMPDGTLHVVEDGEPKNLHVFVRGNPDQEGPVVERRFLQVLCSREPKPFSDGSGRRELAAAIASRDNPLTARVMVNRLWGLLFGAPLVATPSNFGHSGMAPAQGELLDALALRFMERGWSLKAMAREMVLSATYRQTSIVEGNNRAATFDPANGFLWRMNRRRLTIEQWRDSALFVAGQLDETGGKSMELEDSQNHHRTVYARISRLKLDDLLMQFDYPDANVHAEKRSVTTTATQKLFMLNSSFIAQVAAGLADRLAQEESGSDEARISGVYHLLFGREPEPAEKQLALDFLNHPSVSKMGRWAQYAQLLLASNEMIYVD